MDKDKAIAIVSDQVTQRNGIKESHSEIWIKLAQERAIQHILVDPFEEDFFRRIRDCKGLLWRFSASADEFRVAKKLIPAIEHGMNISVFPNWKTMWHFEDKVAQSYLFRSADINTPQTQIHWDQESAIKYYHNAEYPRVLKLENGFQSSNVVIINNAVEANYYINKMFTTGLVSLDYGPSGKIKELLRNIRRGIEIAMGKTSDITPNKFNDLQYGYFLTQAFVPDNEFDYRITVIGSNAYAFRRFNRTGDFRASGSGNIDWNQDAIPKDLIKYAIQIVRKLGMQMAGVDLLILNGEPTVIEVNLAVASWALEKCPGHWLLNSKEELDWIEGSVHPAHLIFDNFISSDHSLYKRR